MTEVVVRRTRRQLPFGLAVLLALGVIVVAGAHNKAGASIDIVKSTVRGSDGNSYWVTNHLTKQASAQVTAADTGTSGGHHEYLLVWAGDSNVSDTTGADIQGTHLAVNPIKTINEDAVDDPPAADFLAVIDADKTSATYGKVLNTATVGPVVENEPHHMQYIWHKGDRIFAGGLFTSVTYVFDVDALPQIQLAGVSLPTDTPGGSIPDAFWTMPDGTAYGTYMGGPVAPGPYTYSDGSTRLGNGYGGSPGEIIHFDKDGKVLSEMPAASAETEDPAQCPNYPAIPGQATCANPHGIQARPDLGVLIASDYAEPRNIVLDPAKPQDNLLFRSTVRVFQIKKDGKAIEPTLQSVSTMPDGPRTERNPGHNEVTGIMETTVTNLPNHKGAFAESMCGGVVYYSPDITVKNPVWREVFDDTAAAKEINPYVSEGAGCDGGGWLQTSPDDKTLYHAVIGRNPGALDAYDTGAPKMLYSLDISKLVAAGSSSTCSIDHIDEVYDGGSEADCPTVKSVLPIPDGTSGGPHWGALDNFTKTSSGAYAETNSPQRIAVSDYFVARTGVNGNHKVCMVNIGTGGALAIDRSFRDENEGTPCVNFNRTNWPHGATGNAKPHSELFVVS